MMDGIKKIQEKIDGLLSLIGERESELIKSPDNLPLKLSTDSYKYQLSQLRTELKLAKIKRDKEFVEIRLKGVGADGSISLDFLSKLSSGFNTAIIGASTIIQYGTKVNKEKAKEVINTLNLRLVGMAPGSTRLYVTANTAPDLFGNSLAEKSLTQSFQLLQSQSPEQLTETASVMGKEGVNGLKRFLSVINNNNLEVDIKWSSPDNKAFEWKGDKQSMQTIVNSLSKITMSEPEVINVKGQLISISLKGGFEIKDDESGKTYRGNYSNDLEKTAQQLNIGKYYITEIEKKKVILEATDAEKIYYTLLAIKKA